MTVLLYTAFYYGIQHIEDRNLLVGYVAMFLEMYDHAQELFLASSHPVAALEVHLVNTRPDLIG